MNKDFWIGYSPERINPGDKKNTIEKVKKIISFENVPQNVEKKIINLYKVITPNLVISRSIKEAETSKVIENIQRDINIAFMNEILVICDKLKINFNNVIKLASTKWNFLNFKPGLVGGHCLPVDPYYLYHLAKKRKLHAKFILAGRNVNNKMENFVLKKILNKIRSKRNCKNVLIAGLSFKSNVSDFRNSLALSIYKKLRKKKTIKVKAYDPYINTKVYKELGIIKKINFNKNKFDLIIFLVNHDAIRAKLIAYKNKFQIMDIFNFLKNN